MTSTLGLCREIARLLVAQNRKVVFAESCTAGLVSGTLARVPGASRFLCGSTVTYRTETKAAWLKIPRPILKSPGPVSKVVALQMAERILEQTPEAFVAASVTGHLGPKAPPRLDGVIYVALAIRRKAATTIVTRWKLQSESRTARQSEAARVVLASLRNMLVAG